jgi:hypothetical protein
MVVMDRVSGWVDGTSLHWEESDQMQDLQQGPIRFQLTQEGFDKQQ